MKEVIIRSKNIEQLNKLRLIFNTELPCYRIAEIQVKSYTSQTLLEVFLTRLSYLPLSGFSDQKQFTIKLSGNITGKEINEIIKPFSIAEDIVLLNQGTFEVKLKIQSGTAKDHSCFLTIDSQVWNPEEGYLKIMPNINYHSDPKIISFIKDLQLGFKESTIEY